MTMSRKDVQIDYTNYRGERALRLIAPVQMWFGRTEWHPEDQWLLDAIDLIKNEKRTFAMRGIHSWTDVEFEERK
jgi:predicted DNA-binding transcriptional regulator YafY